MALGLLLRVSWICFLLFDGSAGSPAIKGYGYPYKSDSRNMGDDGKDGEDEVVTSPVFDQSNWQAINNQPTGPVYTSYDKPTVVQRPAWVPSQQTLPNAPHGSAVESLINGVSRDWGLENPDKPLLFPLPSGPTKPQPGPVQPQSPSTSVDSTYGMPASTSAASSIHSASPTAYHAPSSTSQAAESPSIESWQPEPVSSGYGVVDFNSDSSAAGGYLPHLVYEDVFQYPSKDNAASQSYSAISNTAGRNSEANYMSKGSSTEFASTLEEPSFPRYSANTGSQPVYSSGIGSFPGGENFYLGETVYQPRDELAWWPQKPQDTQTVEVSQGVSEPIFPPAPPSYSFQSRSAYQRGRYLFAQSRYTPEFPSPMPLSVKGVENPTPIQPAAPKGVKNPQRANW